MLYKVSWDAEVASRKVFHKIAVSEKQVESLLINYKGINFGKFR